MKILFITKHYLPRIGGVEKQVSELSKRLIREGYKVSILTLKYDNNLKDREKIDGVEVIRFKVPKVKYLGLLYIWCWMIFHSKLLGSFDLIHTHGVFIWVWPVCYLMPRRPIFTTFHGWEGIYPVPFKNIFIRRIDARLAWGNIAISDYIEKYYGIKADLFSYTAANIPKKAKFKKDRKRLLYVGRLDKNTGLPKILKTLSFLKGFKIDFCGDGPMKKECEKYGQVHGFTDPNPFYEKASVCLSPGITSILEAFTFKCLIATTYDSPLKKDYLLMNPFSKWIIVEGSPKMLSEKIKYYSRHYEKVRTNVKKCYEWVKTQSWDNEVKRYINLWKVKGCA